jgi:hypothetical protein
MGAGKRTFASALTALQATTKEAISHYSFLTLLANSILSTLPLLYKALSAPYKALHEGYRDYPALTPAAKSPS